MIGATMKNIHPSVYTPVSKTTDLLTRYLTVYDQVMVQPSAPSFDDLASLPPHLRPYRPLQIGSQLGHRTAQSNGRPNPSTTT